MPGTEYNATVTVDPKTMDITHDSVAQKGKKQYAVYKFDGDKLTVCITAPGAKAADRPKDVTTAGGANVLFVFERVKGRQ